MKNRVYRRYYFCSLIGAAAICFYPLLMGASVLFQTVKNGAVPLEAYPKYVIPYAPIAVSLLLGVLLMPLWQRLLRKADLLVGSAVSLAVFFITERLMETKVLIQTQELVPLESWQMSLCYVPPEQYETRTWEAVDVLLGGYSPAFKLHFYLISVVILLSLLNWIYGFAKQARTGSRSRTRALAMQTATSLLFLGMCVFACFTAFYRSGELTVSPLSAVLMTIFFLLLGVTMGVFAGSFTLQKRAALSLWFPAAVAAAVVVCMYIGEAFLLNGSLYRFGAGFFFSPLGALKLAPVDLLTVLAAAGVTAAVCRLCRFADVKKGAEQ